jgi:nitroreductase
MNLLRKFVPNYDLVRSYCQYLNRFQDLKSKRRNTAFILSDLRRCCHILDKGLNCIPFEKGHGKKFYEQAIQYDSQIKILNDERILKDPAFKWCEEIIRKYEKAQKGKCSFEKTNFSHYTESEQEILKSFLESRISCRNFMKEKIPKYVWERMISLSQTAPNSCCRQTTRIYVISDDEKISSVVPLLGGATCFGKGIPHLVCFTSTLYSYESVDNLLPYMDAGIFMGTFVMAAHVYNVSTTILNYEHAHAKYDGKVRKILNIPIDEQIIGFCAVGYPEILPIKPERLDSKLITNYL